MSSALISLGFMLDQGEISLFNIDEFNYIGGVLLFLFIVGIIVINNSIVFILIWFFKVSRKQHLKLVVQINKENGDGRDYNAIFEQW